MLAKRAFGPGGGIGRPACRQAGALDLLEFMYSVYVIKSCKRSYIYVGMTNCLSRRFKEHNVGKERTTRAYRPFDLIFSENYATRDEARLREKYLKSGCGKEYIKGRC